MKIYVVISPGDDCLESQKAFVSRAEAETERLRIEADMRADLGREPRPRAVVELDLVGPFTESR